MKIIYLQDEDRSRKQINISFIGEEVDKNENLRFSSYKGKISRKRKKQTDAEGVFAVIV